MTERSIQRKNARLAYWDYGNAGWYFLTICTYQRACLFGSIASGLMHLSRCGELAQRELIASAELRTELTLDSFVIMPNHLHLIAIVDQSRDFALGYSRQGCVRESRSISSFVAGFKSMVTSQERRSRNDGDWRVWQPKFHDHIIRSEPALQAIRQYMLDNPARWELDRFHPDRTGKPDELDSLLDSDSGPLR